MLDGVSYYVPAAPFTNIEHDFKSSLLNGKTSAAGLVPVTVVSGVGANFSQGDLEKTLGGFGGDDVWGSGFLAGMWARFGGVWGLMECFCTSWVQRSLDVHLLDGDVLWFLTYTLEIIGCSIIVLLAVIVSRNPSITLSETEFIRCYNHLCVFLCFLEIVVL